jgi:hypothetical protein
MKTTTLQLVHSINRPRCEVALLLIALTLACFALAPQARAVCQDACLTNGNTVQGDDALINTTGFGNTAIGWQSLLLNTSGGFNTATGGLTLSSNTTGFLNTATGYAALALNTTGINNTATGVQALNFNTVGNNNSAHGPAALYNNRTGSNNTATGDAALYANKIGDNNTASGVSALSSNTKGNNNTGEGYNALYNNTTGSYNVALGFKAGVNLTTGDNNMDIGNKGVAGESATIRIGTNGRQINTYIAGISGATVPTGIPVIVDSSGHLGTTTSSARFKEAIRPMDKASEAILTLKPVTFRYKHALDPEDIPQFGFVAEEVEKVNPDLVARDEQGRPYTVRYEAVNAMLLNEFLKEHRKVAEQGGTIRQLKAELQATATRQQKQIEALTAGLQKVGAELELGKDAPETVANKRTPTATRYGAAAAQPTTCPTLLMP